GAPTGKRRKAASPRVAWSGPFGRGFGDCLPLVSKNQLRNDSALRWLDSNSERRPNMKTLGLSAVAIGAALVCAALPLSFQWSASKVLSISVDQAEARVGRPATATSVAGVNRRMVRRGDRRAAAVGAAAAGAAAVGVAAAYATGPGYVGPAPYARYAGPAS